MKKKKVSRNKYLYFLVSIVLVILIVAEASQIGDYHSSSGAKGVSLTQSDQNAFIVIAKLPGVSVKMQVFLEPSTGYTFDNRTVIAPESNAAALINVPNFVGRNSTPMITVQFNSTSNSRNTGSTLIGENLNFTLTPSNPVSVGFVNKSSDTSLSPSIVVTSQYDYIVIQVSSTVLITYSEVSR